MWAKRMAATEKMMEIVRKSAAGFLTVFVYMHETVKLFLISSGFISSSYHLTTSKDDFLSTDHFASCGFALNHANNFRNIFMTSSTCRWIRWNWAKREHKTDLKKRDSLSRVPVSSASREAPSIAAEALIYALKDGWQRNNANTTIFKSYRLRKSHICDANEISEV